MRRGGGIQTAIRSIDQHRDAPLKTWQMPQIKARPDRETGVFMLSSCGNNGYAWWRKR